LIRDLHFYSPRDYTNISIEQRLSSKHFDFKDLVNWAIQLADGMAFLGSKKVSLLGTSFY
jgi:hypothetical protein